MNRILIAGLWGLILIGSDARADIYNRQLIPLGEGEALTANTGTGDASDAGAVYYNPAGLSDIKENRLTASGSAYLNVSYSIGSLVPGISLPYQESDLQTIPTTYVAVLKWGDWHVAAAALVPDSQELNGVIDPTGSSTDLGGTLDAKNSDLWLGLAASHRISDDWSWGVSLFGISHSELASVSLSGQVTSNGTPTILNEISRTSLSTFGFSAILGLKFRASESVSLGLRLQTPFVQVSGTADSYANVTQTPSAGGTPSTNVTYLPGQQARYELPTDFTLGAAWNASASWKILFDTSFQSAAHYLTIPSNSSSNSYGTKPTFRFNFGSTWDLSEAFGISAGLYYNPSATDPNTESTGSSILNYYGITAGVTFRSEHVHTALGFVSVNGSGQEISVPGSASTPLSSTALGGVLTTSYLF